jgi:hypothetical protein
MDKIQVKVFRPYENSDKKLYRVTWVEKSWSPKVGQCISFTDEPQIFWEIEEVYTTVTTGDFNTRWGLNLPKSQRTER